MDSFFIRTKEDTIVLKENIDNNINVLHCDTRRHMTNNSTHHIFAQEERKMYNTDIQENKIPMERKKHDALYNIFANDHPKEQLLKILQLNVSVIAPDIVTILQKVLELSEEEFYIQEVFNRKQQKER